MKKIISVPMLVILLLSLAAISLTGCSLFQAISYDQAKSNLENAGYEVTVMTGEQYVEREDAFPSIMAFELEHYIYAVKGDDEIHIFFFISTQTAEDNAGFMHCDDLSAGQHNEVVYFATKQAKSDAGI